MKTKRRVHCQGCRGKTTEQTLLRVESDAGPIAETWRCDTCGYLLLTLGTITDAEQVCRNVVEEICGIYDHGDDGRRLDFDDLTGRMSAELWVAWTRFDPTRGVPFLAYAVGTLRQRRTDWLRKQLGRSDPDPLLSAESLDAYTAEADSNGRDPLGEAVGLGAMDGGEHSLADFRRALELRDREVARRERAVGTDASARSAA